jgi:hypothetical protein
MSKVRSIQFKKQHIIALVGLWAGLAAAALVLGANEVIERRLRA